MKKRLSYLLIILALVFMVGFSGSAWDSFRQFLAKANTWTGVQTFAAIIGETLDTGQGANELYGMDQDVQTTDDPIFEAAFVDVDSSRTLSVAECSNTIVRVNGAYTVTLADVSGYVGSDGGNCYIYATTAAAFSVDVYTSDLIVRYGTAQSDGEKIDSPGTKSAAVFMFGPGAAGWEAHRANGSIFINGG